MGMRNDRRLQTPARAATGVERLVLDAYKLADLTDNEGALRGLLQHRVPRPDASSG